MYYPEELVEEVRARNDIVDVISGYVSLKKKGSNYWGCCPRTNRCIIASDAMPAEMSIRYL